MSFKILTVPFDNKIKDFDNTLLEKYINNKKILNYKVELINQGGEYYWTLFYEYELLEGIEEPKNIIKLSESEIALFNKLKEWRLEESKKLNIPSYVIAKNEHLIQIIKIKPKTLQELKNINGIGDKKIKEIKTHITKFLNQKLKLEINGKSTFINKVDNGIPYCGVRIFKKIVRIK